MVLWKSQVPHCPAPLHKTSSTCFASLVPERAPSCNHYRAALPQQAIEMAVLPMLAVGGHRFPSPVTQSAKTGGRGRGIQQILGPLTQSRPRCHPIPGDRALDASCIIDAVGAIARTWRVDGCGRSPPEILWIQRKCARSSRGFLAATATQVQMSKSVKAPWRNKSNLSQGTQAGPRKL